MKQIAPSISSSARESSHFNLLTKQNRSRGFTIVELLVVIVVIAILATVAIVAYNGIQQKARVATLQSDLSQAATALGMANAENSAYPGNTNECPSPILGSGNICLKSSPGTAYQYTYTSADNSYCLTAINGNIAYMISNANSTSAAGVCPGHTGPVSAIANGWDRISNSGNESNCALTSGKAYCWGLNIYGQLGNNTTNNGLIPIAVSTAGVLSGKTVTDIDAAWYHTCAIANGQPYCWGHNDLSQLGNGTTTDSSVPVAVSATGVLAGKTVTKIDTSMYHTCAIANGQPYCWGWNPYGQLGNGTVATSSVPVTVSTTGVLAGKTVTDIATGFDFTCAVADGKPYCWGRNNYGQLGDGTMNSSTVPIAVSMTGVLAGKTVTKIAIGNNVCVIADGQAFCWGYNVNGEIGDGTTTNSSIPVAVVTSGVLSGKTVTSIANGSHTCVVASGLAYCWGSNAYGSLGIGATSPNYSAVPVAVITSGVLAGKTVTGFSTGNSHTCAIADGRAICWGGNFRGQLGDGTLNDTWGVPIYVTQP